MRGLAPSASAWGRATGISWRTEDLCLAEDLEPVVRLVFEGLEPEAQGEEHERYQCGDEALGDRAATEQPDQTG